MAETEAKRQRLLKITQQVTNGMLCLSGKKIGHFAKHQVFLLSFRGFSWLWRLYAIVENFTFFFTVHTLNKSRQVLNILKNKCICLDGLKGNQEKEILPSWLPGDYRISEISPPDFISHYALDFIVHSPEYWECAMIFISHICAITSRSHMADTKNVTGLHNMCFNMWSLNNSLYCDPWHWDWPI